MQRREMKLIEMLVLLYETLHDTSNVSTAETVSTELDASQENVATLSAFTAVKVWDCGENPVSKAGPPLAIVTVGYG